MKKDIRELITSKFVGVAEVDPLSEMVMEVAKDKENMLACVLARENNLKGIITPKKDFGGGGVK